ncbi:HD domain-containing protein [Micromonospora sp. M12]
MGGHRRRCRPGDRRRPRVRRRSGRGAPRRGRRGDPRRLRTDRTGGGGRPGPRHRRVRRHAAPEHRAPDPSGAARPGRARHAGRTGSVVRDGPAPAAARRRHRLRPATAGGRATENHAEHCWAVAVYGALLADDTGADPAEAFLLGLAHHLHNARLPDAGFAGEVLLGVHLEPVTDRLTERELAELPDPLAARVGEVLASRADAETPLGRTFHAADVLDRVLQVHHHARAAAFTAEQALVDLALVHDGPVVDYHRAVLRAAGL